HPPGSIHCCSTSFSLGCPPSHVIPSGLPTAALGRSVAWSALPDDAVCRIQRLVSVSSRSGIHGSRNTHMPTDLKSLKFGAPAAERDIGQGLEDYFVESDASQNVASGAKTVHL